MSQASAPGGEVVGVPYTPYDDRHIVLLITSKTAHRIHNAMDVMTVLTRELFSPG